MYCWALLRSYASWWLVRLQSWGHVHDMWPSSTSNPHEKHAFMLLCFLTMFEYIAAANHRRDERWDASTSAAGACSVVCKWCARVASSTLIWGARPTAASTSLPHATLGEGLERAHCWDVEVMHAQRLWDGGVDACSAGICVGSAVCHHLCHHGLLIRSQLRDGCGDVVRCGG